MRESDLRHSQDKLDMLRPRHANGSGDAYFSRYADVKPSGGHRAPSPVESRSGFRHFTTVEETVAVGSEMFANDARPFEAAARDREPRNVSTSRWKSIEEVSGEQQGWQAANSNDSTVKRPFAARVERAQTGSSAVRGVDQLMASIDPEELSRMSSDELKQMLQAVEAAKADLVRSIPNEVLQAAQNEMNPDQLQELMSSFGAGELHGLNAQDVLNFVQTI